MGAGKKPVNIFKGLRSEDEPREVINWRLWFAVVSFGIMGAARGVDEGLISGMFVCHRYDHSKTNGGIGTIGTPNFKKITGLSKMNATEAANVTANISAMVQIGSVGGALL